uniref:Menorin-like domain-containing protein n=1 Tax=Timema douglasi TaxID=61478 RepID=A0A7R8VWM8_TIMDO|nr:unnamed protein product [Timema douglasi]
MKIASSEEMPSMREFFPRIKNDLTKLTWAKNVNNAVAIQDALEATSAFNLEKLSTLHRDESTLSSRIQYSTNNKETPSAVERLTRVIKFPLWLNAVTDDMEDKDINKFLSLCTNNFPKATISIGMLHKGQTLGSKRGYSAKLVTQMKDTLTRNNVTQPVAFPVIAPIAADSLDTLPALKDVHGITDSALYMYDKRFVDYSNDYINKMKKLVNIFGKNRVYLDSYANLAYYFSMTPYKSG